MTIRAEYIAGGISQRKLAEKYGVSYNTLIKRANDEKWATDRKDAYNKGAKKAQQKVADKAANNAVKLERAREMLIDRIISAIEQMPEKSGTHVRQTQSDRDTGRQLSVDYDLMTLVSALEKLSSGAAADKERQKQFAQENNTVLMSYADLFSRPARKRTIEEIESGGKE